MTHGCTCDGLPVPLHAARRCYRYFRPCFGIWAGVLLIRSYVRDTTHNRVCAGVCGGGCVDVFVAVGDSLAGDGVIAFAET